MEKESFINQEQKYPNQQGYDSDQGQSLHSDQSDNQEQKSQILRQIQTDTKFTKPYQTKGKEIDLNKSDLKEKIVSKRQGEKPQQQKSQLRENSIGQRDKKDKLTDKNEKIKSLKEEKQDRGERKDKIERKDRGDKIDRGEKRDKEERKDKEDRNDRVEGEGERKKRRQRQTKPQQIYSIKSKLPSEKKQSKSESNNYIQMNGGQQWNSKAIQSEEGQELISDEEGEQHLHENQQKIAFLQDQDINNLSTQPQQQLNNACIQKEVSIKYEHWVENKHLLVLYLLFRREIYEMFPKKMYNRLDIHPSNKNKIRIFGTTHQEVKEISNKISEIINKIAIVKLNIRNQEATRLKSSKLLNRKLLKDKMVIFKFGNSNDKSYYLGGKGTQPQLSCVFKEIRNLKFRYFRMFDYPNTRSYNVIMGHFIRQKELLKAFLKWNLKNLEIVPFIPKFDGYQNKKEKEKSLCFLMTTVGNMENFSPKEIENNLAPFIKNNFYSIVLIFKKGEKYLPKLEVEGIFFRYVFEKKFSWAYLYILCLKKEFFQKRSQIIKQVEKLSQKNIIFGVRYFNHLSPQRSEYIRPQIYKEVKFPQNRPPYSYSIISRKIKTQEIKKEKVQMKQLVDQNKQQVGQAKQDGGQIKQSSSQIKQQSEQMVQTKQQRQYYKFDWEGHLMNLQSTEVSFIEEKKN